MTASPPAAATEIARAKVNLCLHVTGLREDGYHLLDSLVAFPALGDRIEAEPASGLSLTIDGPFAAGLSASGDNLVLRAAEALRALAPGAPGAALRLTKSLPVASGIGGGSADAAAALRALNRLWGLGLPQARLEALGLSLGADVPVCIASAPRRMAGVGEALSPMPPLPEAWIALVNPLVETPTPAVFKALVHKDNPPVPAPPEGWADAAVLAAWLAEETRNDLFVPAAAQVPAVEEARAALAARPGCLLARMSGSGATVFGLFAGQEAALAAAADLPGRWWRAAAPLG